MAKPILTLEDRFLAKVEPEPNSGCLLWTCVLNNKGYGMLHLVVDGKRKTKLAHRISWELANGPIPDGLWCLHKCDVRSCVAVEHLFLGTRLDNVADMVLKERGCNGEHYGSNEMAPGRFRSSVTFLGKQYHLGVYGSAVEASEAAKTFRAKCYGRGN